MPAAGPGWAHDPASDADQRAFAAHVVDLQERICAALKAVDPGLRIEEDPYARRDAAGEPGGGGLTRALSGEVFEGGGVNTSEVWGVLDPGVARDLGGEADARMWAAGISLILHPRNPRVPTTHMNFRMIRLGDAVWFGGGADLTPYWPHLDDFRHFHGAWRDACAPLGTYAAWKATCDRYFANTHREGEMRGIGGVFFDRWRRGTVADDAAEVCRLSETFLPSYLPIVAQRSREPFTEADEAFMLWRRGRYVEFNLLHDRGTRFGLRSNGRTASILVSLPPRVTFAYHDPVAPGSPHAEMMRYYRPHAWA